MSNNSGTPAPRLVAPNMPIPQRRPQQQLPQAAAEAVARYAEVFEENERLSNECVKLRQENDTLRRVDAEKTALISDLRKAFEESQRTADARLAKAETEARYRLAESERAKERYLRYAVSISERLKTCGDQIAAAHDIAMELAHERDRPDAAVEAAIEQAISAAQ